MSVPANNAPLIPDIAGLTDRVIKSLGENDQSIIKKIAGEMQSGSNPVNVEQILTRIRNLADAIGPAKIHNLDGQGYQDLEKRICNGIGACVSVSLPAGENPYGRLVSWIGGMHRTYPVEVFTINYDLLLEEAFERAGFPYFDGFTGARMPFFDSASVENVEDDLLPARWSRVWKLHGSLGWSLQENREFSGNKIAVRTGKPDDASLIYPTHLKYDQATQMPYSALFARLRKFLMTPDSILICTGFSVADSHIASLFKEALTANAHAAVLAFQYKSLGEENSAVNVAKERHNFSVYTPDGAVIGSVSGKWHVEDVDEQQKEMQKIRRLYWAPREAGSSSEFLLGDFAKLARFFVLARAEYIEMASDAAAKPGSIAEEGAQNA